MNAKFLKLFLFIPLSLSLSALASEECENWFKKSGISSADANCDLKCTALSNGMDNFMCPSQCEQLCKNKPAPDCPGWTLWKKNLQDSSSNTWVKIQKPKPWDDIQRQTVLNALSKLGSAFLPLNLSGIYRASRDPDPFNPGNPAASLDGQIILYDRAFSSGSELNRILAHEIVHVLIASSLKLDFAKYKNEMGWSDSVANPSRPGPFITPDSAFAPEEDFAHNVDTYLFDPSALKQKLPQFYNWMDKDVAKKLKLQKGCANEKP